jgi:D-glycero-D-manno-heptose 1,7-bisphosphate phosphatase
VDRDGTLIEDRGFVHRREDYMPLPGAIEGLRLLQQNGFGVAIVTNQSGIARGYYTDQDFLGLQRHLFEDFAKQGVRIEGSYHCPHLPEEGCPCRKPGIGLLLRAVEELGADLESSFVIGDKPADMEMAHRAGCRPVYVLTGEGERLRSELPPNVDVVDNLLAAAHRILGLRSA